MSIHGLARVATTVQETEVRDQNERKKTSEVLTCFFHLSLLQVGGAHEDLVLQERTDTERGTPSSLRIRTAITYRFAQP